MKMENLVVVLGVVGGLGIFAGATYDAWAIIISVIIILLLSGWLFTKLQSSDARGRTAGNPITTNDQNAMGFIAFVIVLVFYCIFFYIGTLFNPIF